LAVVTAAQCLLLLSPSFHYTLFNTNGEGCDRIHHLKTTPFLS